MAQQINLLTPILLTPQRHFSALTLLQASALLLVVGLGTTLWLLQRGRAADVEHQALLARYAAERQQLTAARANLPAPLDAGSLQQQLQTLEAGNAQRRALLHSLAGSDTGAGQRHSELLALVARTLPASAWLGELRYAPGRLELSGGTLNTDVLRPWLAQMSAHPLLTGQQLAALRVERLGAPGGDADKPLLPAADRLAQSGVPVWAYRVVSAPAGGASEVAR